MADPTIDELREALRDPLGVRIELGSTFSLSAGVVQTAALSVRQSRKPGGADRWRRVGPLLLPPENGDRAALLGLLASLAEDRS